jgi:hypothetical protein
MQSRRGESLLAFMMAALLLAAIPSSADVGPIERFKGGGAVAPRSPHKTIRLDSQEVTIRLGAFKYTVDAVFHFLNTGDITTEWVGFPTWVESRDGTRGVSNFIRFDSWVNDQSVEFSPERDQTKDSPSRDRQPSSASEAPTMNLTGTAKKEPEWLARQVTFPEHENTTIRVTYEAPYYPNYDKGRGEAIYLYETGSMWKGNIGKAIFIVDASEVGGLKHVSISFEKAGGTLPGAENMRLRPWSISKNVVRYDMEDFEPEPGAQLVISFPREGRL